MPLEEPKRKDASSHLLERHTIPGRRLPTVFDHPFAVQPLVHPHGLGR